MNKKTMFVGLTCFFLGILLCLATAGVIAQKYSQYDGLRLRAAAHLASLDQINVIRSKLVPALGAISTNVALGGLEVKYQELQAEFADLEAPPPHIQP